uniref:Cytochrome b5 n=1 Tax=Clastoptera arizonana TaxID=38151 RepID=A0A1B6E3L9_9HEMI
MEEPLTSFYSLQEVKELNGVDGRCVFVVNNSVYDATPYLSKHPGGPELLTEQGGKDATKPFKDAGHSLDARELMEKYKIGELNETDRKTDIVIKVKDTKFDKSAASVRWMKCVAFAVLIVVLLFVVCYFILK